MELDVLSLLCCFPRVGVTVVDIETSIENSEIVKAMADFDDHPFDPEPGKETSCIGPGLQSVNDAGTLPFSTLTEFLKANAGAMFDDWASNGIYVI